MAWGRIDDKLHANPKFLLTSLEATGLWLRCYSWVNDQLTDGHLPTAIVALYGAARAKKLAAELVANGLWEVNPAGWQIHDYLEYNPSKEEIMESRQDLSTKRSEAGKKGMASRWGAKNTDNKPDSKPGFVNNKRITKPYQPDSKTITPTRPDPTHTHPRDDDRSPGESEGVSGAVSESSSSDLPIGTGRDAGQSSALSAREARAAFIAVTLAAKPDFWRSEFDSRCLAAGKSASSPWAESMLRNWLAGDGTPQERSQAAQNDRHYESQEWQTVIARHLRGVPKEKFSALEARARAELERRGRNAPLPDSVADFMAQAYRFDVKAALSTDPPADYSTRNIAASDTTDASAQQ